MKMLKLKDILPKELKDQVLSRRGNCLKIDFAEYTYVRVTLVYYLKDEVYIFRVTQRIRNPNINEV
ncbi:MAG: hypothetical protein PHH69_03675 [Candidatus Omnitrophica bacterium]|nr:hypothetical protein [Candidatus Omnitrophota bacterium]MDD5610629.1 hypothetical protein [Candidatus Omnitrophota bacterium]